MSDLDLGPIKAEPEWSNNPDDWPHTPPLEVFRAFYDQDDNIWWRTECGHHMNLFDSALEKVDTLIEEVERLRAARQRALYLHKKCVTGTCEAQPNHCAECFDEWPCPTVRALEMEP